MDMLKNKDIHIKITDEKYQIIKKLATERYCKITGIIEQALDNFLKITLGNRLNTKKD